jgi:hypothetical protein
MSYSLFIGDIQKGTYDGNLNPATSFFPNLSYKFLHNKVNKFLRENVKEVVPYLNSISDLEWSTHMSDMKKVSRQFPEIIFIVDYVDVDQEVSWRKFFKNGKVQKSDAERVVHFKYANFDESLLKEIDLT